MTEQTEKTVTFQVTLTISDPAVLREAALQYWLEGGGIEADFIENEQREDAIADTPVGSWILALFDHPRNMGRASKNSRTMSIAASFISPRHCRRDSTRRRRSAARR